MKTICLLMAQYDARAVVPIDMVCRDYFAPLTVATLVRMEAVRKAFPGPVCFLPGEEQALAALPAQGHVEPVKCPACRTQFNIPIDES